MLIFNVFDMELRKEGDWPSYCEQIEPNQTISFSVNNSWTNSTYCLQSLPDYAIMYNINYNYTNSAYCSQTFPDSSFTQAP